MKKYWLFLFMLIPMSAFAANMCVKNDTVFVVLDPVIAPTSTSYDNAEHTWSAIFSFGTISGIAGCGLYDVMGGVNVVNVKTPNQNAPSLSATDKAYYTCACKMLLPVESYWINVFYQGGAQTAACSTLCAGKCREKLSNSTVRGLLFGNVIP